jgi:hypothetical protein
MADSSNSKNENPNNFQNKKASRKDAESQRIRKVLFIIFSPLNARNTRKRIALLVDRMCFVRYQIIFAVTLRLSVFA